MINAQSLIDKFRFALDNKWGYIWGTAGIEWTAARQKQKINYLVSKYGESWKKNADAKKDRYYMCGMYGDKWVGHMVADCSGLFAWAFKQLGGAIAHGSNSIFDRYCSGKGKITDQIRKTMLPGTAVFVDKSGDKSHIGLYVGNNTVVEAASTQAGVCTSKLNTSKWTYWGTLKGVDYSAVNAPETPSAPEDDSIPVSSLPTLRKGNTGEYVTLLQTKLKNAGYDIGKFGVDGDFGSATLAAVKKFQREHGLDPDGIVGQKTWAALEGGEAVLYSVVIPNLTAEKADQIIALYKGAYKEIERG